LFYMILLDDKFKFGSDIASSIPETFNYDLCRVQGMRTEFLYLRSMCIFFPMVIENSMAILKRPEMELEDEIYVQNVTKLSTSIFEQLHNFQKSDEFLEPFSAIPFNSKISDCFYIGMLLSNLLTDEEAVYVLDKSVYEFETEIWKKRFDTL